MTREELNKKLELSNQISNNEKFSGDLHLRNHIELRLIADALIDISKSLKTKNIEGYDVSLAESLFNIYEHK